MTAGTPRQNDLRMIEETDALGEEVRILALNLAIYLAKTKNASDDIDRLEPDFIRLVNGTVKVVQELGIIIGAARNMQKMVWDVASGRVHQDLLEMKLRSIVDQCGVILGNLSGGSGDDSQRQMLS